MGTFRATVGTVTGYMIKAGRGTLPFSAYDVGMTTPTMGEKLRAARGRRGYTQEQAADAIGCSQRTYAAWERDEAIPQSHWMAKIEAALGEIPTDTAVPPPDLAEQARVAAGLDAQVLIAEVGRRFALIPPASPPVTGRSGSVGEDWTINRRHLRKPSRTDRPDATESNEEGA